MKSLELYSSELNTKGVTVVKSVIDKEIIAQCHAILLADLEAHHTLYNNAQKTDIEALFNEGENGDASLRTQQHYVKGEFPLSIRKENAFMQLVLQKKLIDTMRYLIGDERLKIHVPPMIRFKDPKCQTTFVPWHQDRAYFPHLKRFLISWIPLQPITGKVKGLEFIADNNKKDVTTYGNKAWNYTVSPEYTAAKKTNKKIIPELELGDVLVFNSNVVHRSVLKSEFRLSVDCRWFPPQQSYEKRYYDVVEKRIIDAF